MQCHQQQEALLLSCPRGLSHPHLHFQRQFQCATQCKHGAPCSQVLLSHSPALRTASAVPLPSRPAAYFPYDVQGWFPSTIASEKARLALLDFMTQRSSLLTTTSGKGAVGKCMTPATMTLHGRPVSKAALLDSCLQGRLIATPSTRTCSPNCCSRLLGQLSCTLALGVGSPLPPPPGSALLCYPGKMQGLISSVPQLMKGGASSLCS